MDNEQKPYCNCPVVDANYACWKEIPMQITEETTQIEEVVTAETTTEEVVEVEATEETIEPEYVDEQTAEETTEEVVEVEATEEAAA